MNKFSRFKGIVLARGVPMKKAKAWPQVIVWLHQLEDQPSVIELPGGAELEFVPFQNREFVVLEKDKKGRPGG